MNRRPLPVSDKGIQERCDADFLGVRPHVRYLGYYFTGGGPAALNLGDLVYSENIVAYAHVS